jgi:hypothetical protein
MIKIAIFKTQVGRTVLLGMGTAANKKQYI